MGCQRRRRKLSNSESSSFDPSQAQGIRVSKPRTDSYAHHGRIRNPVMASRHGRARPARRRTGCRGPRASVASLCAVAAARDRPATQDSDKLPRLRSRAKPDRAPGYRAKAPGGPWAWSARNAAPSRQATKPGRQPLAPGRLPPAQQWPLPAAKAGASAIHSTPTA